MNCPTCGHEVDHDTRIFIELQTEWDRQVNEARIESARLRQHGFEAGLYVGRWIGAAQGGVLGAVP